MTKQVLIIGGGAGATILANSLNKRDFETTVVSASAQHLFQPALLYIAFSNASAKVTRDERSLLARHVRFVHDAVTHVDLNRQVATTAGGAHLEYDYVVLATGMSPDLSSIPGLSEVDDRYGDYHSSVAQAQKLWRNLDNFEGGTIALGQSFPIIKCPPSPLEGILLADRLLRRRGLREKSHLVYFTPYPRPYPAAPMSELIEPILKDRGIEVFTFFDVDRIDPATQTIHSIEGDQIHYDLPIVIPPFGGAKVTFEPPEVVDADRFVIVDKQTLRVKGTDSAFAIGDGSNVPTSKAGVGAHLEAKVVARTLAGHAATFDGRTNCPFDLGDGRGTFVVGSFDAPVVKAAPSRLKHFMKMAFARIYWLSLRGTLEPIFSAYFALTRPARRPAEPQARV
ncbi:MAG TPA: FAD-dependent oxidoreductase [Acidimicrobiales bacterium]|nr:FAD-dependent oxidoreductase [Acidimicrobiales bacterium]